LVVIALPAHETIAQAPSKPPPEGILAGTFLVLPRIDMQREFTDNVQRAANGPVSDQVTRVTPSVAASSMWSRHALNASISLTDETHHRLKGESADTHLMSLNGRIDAHPGLAFPLALEHERIATKRGHPNEARGRDRHTDTVVRQRAGLQWKTGQWLLELGTQFQNTDAKDTVDLAGREINRDDEDRSQTDHSVKLSYQINPHWSVFAKGRRTKVDYDDPFDDRLFDRDSSGGATTVGVTFALAPQRMFSLEAGRERRQFRGALGRFSDSTLDALAVWAFTPELVGTVSHSRMFEETVLPGSPGLSVRSTLMNLRWGTGKPWSSDVSFSRSDSAPVRLPVRFRQDTVSAAARYAVNRHFQLRLEVAHNRQPADGAVVPGYREDVVTLGLLAAY
jgi:hypothetical protein